MSIKIYGYKLCESTYHVFLDLANIDESVRKDEEIFTRADSSSKKSLLIVEDHFELRSFIKEIFQNSFRVLVAGNGIEALEIIESYLEQELRIDDRDASLMYTLSGVASARLGMEDRAALHFSRARFSRQR